MPRPHTLFIQAQHIPWNDGDGNGYHPELQTRTLSVEDDGSAATVPVPTIGGPLDNTFASEAKPFLWDPPLRPSPPPELRALARPYERQRMDGLRPPQGRSPSRASATIAAS